MNLLDNKPIYAIPRETKLKWWGEGPWIDEPDEYRFKHMDLECLVKRMAVEDGPGHVFGGFLNGYVRIPEGHPDWVIGNFENHDIYEAHGGLTLNGELEGEKGFWIGFDCAHSFDVTPSMIEMKKKMRENIIKTFRDLDLSNSPIFCATYRTFDFVVKEVKKLADQVKARESPK